MTYNETWSESIPAGSEARSLGDDRIRAFKYAIRERLASDHEFYADESGHAYVGYHAMIHLTQQSSPTATTDIGHLYVKNVSGTTELFFMDEAGNEKQLTSAGKLNISSAEAVDLTSSQTIAGTKTFTISPVVPTPTTDYQASTKKYVDDTNTTQNTTIAAIKLGAWVDKSTSYGAQVAATDGFVVGVIAVTSGSTDVSLYGYSDANANPTTVRYSHIEDADGIMGNADVRSFMFPVRKADYWKVTISAGVTVTAIYWLPLGA